jgi:hypothetical protein
MIAPLYLAAMVPPEELEAAIRELVGVPASEIPIAELVPEMGTEIEAFLEAHRKLYEMMQTNRSLTTPGMVIDHRM